MAQNRNKAFITPENITKDNAADVLKLWLAVTAMMDDTDNIQQCIAKAISFAIEVLEEANGKQSNL